MSDGWIKIDRGIKNHWLWQNAEYLKAWLDLIMLANYEDKKIPYKGEIITCKRGVVNLSITKLSQRWGCSRDKARYFLHLLENDNMVEVKATTNRTTITIVNYGKYQDRATAKSTTNQSTNPTTSKATNPQRSDTTKKYKNNKESKESKEEGAALNSDLPTLAELNGADEDGAMDPMVMMEMWKRGEISFE